MGITTVNFFVSNKPRSTLDDVIACIEPVARLVGVEHVGIGSDSSIGGWRQSFPTEKAFWDFHGQCRFKPGADVRWLPCIEELDVPERLRLIRRLLQRGFPTPMSPGSLAAILPDLPRVSRVTPGRGGPVPPLSGGGGSRRQPPPGRGISRTAPIMYTFRAGTRPGSPSR